METSLKTPYILLVEDNPDDIDLTMLAFRKSRLAGEVVVARDGVEALDHLLAETSEGIRASQDPPIVTLLDLKLPRLDGLSLLQKLREHPATRLLRVVVLTSSREESDLLRSYELGACSYIRKPVDFEEFTDAVSRLGTYWLRLNEPPPRVATP